MPVTPLAMALAFRLIDPPVPAASAPLFWIHAPPLARKASSLPSDSRPPGALTPKLMLPPFCQVWSSALPPRSSVTRSLVQRPRTSNVTPSPKKTPGRCGLPAVPTVSTL
jgi:hypothetical protein